MHTHPPGSKIVWKTADKTSEKLQGLQLADGRTLYTVTFQTSNTLGPGFCYMTASALLYGLRPHALWWSGTYTGMITKVLWLHNSASERKFMALSYVVDSRLAGPVLGAEVL